VPPCDQPHLVAFGFYSRYQRGLFFDCPLSPLLGQRDDFHIGHFDLLLVPQKAFPVLQSIDNLPQQRCPSQKRSLEDLGAYVWSIAQSVFGRLPHTGELLSCEPP
jgi:hypothetical protein